MTKVKNFIDKFKSILTEFETGEVKLEEGKIADTDIILRWGEVGQPVLKVAIAEDGTETTEAMPEGEYVLESGDVLVVDAMGNLLELKPKAEAPAPLPEEDMSKKPEEELAPAPEVPAVPEEAPAAPAVGDKKLAEIIDVSKDGEYMIKVVVAGGAITEATVEANQNLIQESEFNAVKAENAELKDKLDKLVVKPLFTQFTQPKEKQDFKPKNNLEAVKHKLGLDK